MNEYENRRMHGSTVRISIFSDFVQFEFYPVTGEIEEDDDNGLTYLDLDYDTTNEDIHTIKINV